MKNKLFLLVLTIAVTVLALNNFMVGLYLIVERINIKSTTLHK